MSSSYEVTINGAAAVTMQSLGLSFTGLRLQNMQPDEADLSWVRRRLQACPLAHNDKVEIWRSGRRLFVGRARLGAITNTGCGIKLVGPWSHLEEQLYQLSLLDPDIGDPDGRVFGNSFAVTYPAGSSIESGIGGTVTLPADLTITTTLSNRTYYAGYPATTRLLDTNSQWTARGWLFRPGGTAGQIYTTIADEWARVMAFMATTNAPDLFDVGTVELGGTVSPKVRTFSDATVGEILRQVLAMKPDAAIWWNYAGDSLPTINVRVASLETPLALRIGRVDGSILGGYQVRVTDDLVPTGVMVRWENDASTSTGLGSPRLVDFYPGMIVLKNVTLSSGSTTVTCESTAGLAVGDLLTNSTAVNGVAVTAVTNATTFSIATAPSGSSSGLTLYAIAPTGAPMSYEPGVLLHTIDAQATIAPGIAREIYTSLAVRRGQGSIAAVDRDFSLGLRPGRVITLDDDPALAGVQLWVQGVSWSPDTGIAQLTVGYPAHLRLQDRVDLRGWFRMAFEGPWWSHSFIVPSS